MNPFFEIIDKLRNDFSIQFKKLEEHFNQTVLDMGDLIDKVDSKNNVLKTEIEKKLRMEWSGKHNATHSNLVINKLFLLSLK